MASGQHTMIVGRVILILQIRYLRLRWSKWVQVTQEAGEKPDSFLTLEKMVSGLLSNPSSPWEGLLEFSGSHQIPKATWRGQVLGGSLSRATWGGGGHVVWRPPWLLATLVLGSFPQQPLPGGEQRELPVQAEPWGLGPPRPLLARTPPSEACH